LKTYKECVGRQDTSFEPLAASVGPTGGPVAVRKEKEKKKKRLTANFAHAQPRPLWTDCNQIWYVGSGGRYDHWRQVTL